MITDVQHRRRAGSNSEVSGISLAAVKGERVSGMANHLNFLNVSKIGYWVKICLTLGRGGLGNLW